MSSTHTVSHATLEDIASLLELEDLFPSDFISRRQFLYHLRNPRAIFLVIRTSASQILVGYALFLTRQGQAARFYSLIIHPDMRGKGFARMLCEEGISRLLRKGQSAVSLEVDAEDAGAIRLYESLGFKQTGVITNYYEDGRNALKMNLKLRT